MSYCPIPNEFGPTWWLIPLSKWVITPVINGISRVNPLITGVITHLLSGMSHQVLFAFLFRHFASFSFAASTLWIDDDPISSGTTKSRHRFSFQPLPILDTLQETRFFAGG